MEKFVCPCGYVYNPKEHNNIPFEELPEEYTCPVCGLGKDIFEKDE